jgi:hypothetical protein
MFSDCGPCFRVPQTSKTSQLLLLFMWIWREWENRARKGGAYAFHGVFSLTLPFGRACLWVDNRLYGTEQHSATAFFCSFIFSLQGFKNGTGFFSRWIYPPFSLPHLGRLGIPIRISITITASRLVYAEYWLTGTKHV